MTSRRLWKSRATKSGLSVSLALIIVFALVVGTSGGRGASSLKHTERVSGGPHRQVHRGRRHPQDQARDRDPCRRTARSTPISAPIPGADGIPMKHGKPTVCVIDPATGSCVAPYADHADVNGGGPHNARTPWLTSTAGR